MKNVFILITFLVYTTTLFGAYDVKIGVYKNAKNLRIKIAKIKSIKYRRSIKIEKKNRLYYAHAILASNKDAQNALHAYKKIFKDAFIAKEQVVLKSNKKRVKKKLVAKSEAKKQVLSKKIEAKKLLGHQTVYLCYDKSPKHLKKRVVQMVFDEQMVKYTPLDNKKNQLDIEYTFENAKVRLNLLDMNITHEIDAIHTDYLSARSSVSGETAYTLRYYFNEKEALAFVKRH